MTRPTVHRQDHPLAQAHSPTPAQGGTVVYVICGYDGAPARAWPQQWRGGRPPQTTWTRRGRGSGR